MYITIQIIEPRHRLFGLTPCCLLYFWIQTCIRHHFYFIVIINSWTSFWCITQISIRREKLKKLKKERLTIKWLWTGAIAEVKKMTGKILLHFGRNPNKARRWITSAMRLKILQFLPSFKLRNNISSY